MSDFVGNMRQYNTAIQFLNPNNNKAIMVKNYFLNDERIVGSGLNFAQMRIDGIKGYVIEERFLNDFLSQHNLKVLREFTTAYDGLSRIETAVIDGDAPTPDQVQEASKYRVIVEDWNGL